MIPQDVVPLIIAAASGLSRWTIPWAIRRTWYWMRVLNRLEFYIDAVNEKWCDEWAAELRAMNAQGKIRDM